MEQTSSAGHESHNHNPFPTSFVILVMYIHTIFSARPVLWHVTKVPVWRRLPARLPNIRGRICKHIRCRSYLSGGHLGAYRYCRRWLQCSSS
ncbi:uncharacterized protein M421DRAFT_274162 [Didymella exigua CBS 183.55]|uniref:Uncharacterized protein n=1 Tax=Didymella exigua CBS 183.55 TaxID=1150837 RepID=A0A6A5RBW0_9PLEO|nr:uncharacterized protein M421DRAFT_274162 [Didymella exigua CBS 183.55]KAF1924678.1 hypothetical protein M421DRAFT_274162 [Didymella exigua CBS 183.55]